MADVLATISSLAVQVFAVSSMAAIGLRYSVEEIIGPLRDLWAVVLALVANFVAVPILAFGILQFDDTGRVIGFKEKPKTEEELKPVRTDPAWIDAHGIQSKGRDCLANMGI